MRSGRSLGWRHALRDDLGHGLGRDWAAEEVALRFAATELAEAVQLLGRLNALGDRGHVQLRAELYDQLDDGLGIVLPETVDEGAVDLDLVEREGAEITER